MNGSRRSIAVFVLLLGSILFAHSAAVAGMKSMWDHTPMYSFGYIVPFLSAFMVYGQRERLAQLTSRPAAVVGSLVTLAACAMLLAGRVAGVLLFEQFAFVTALVAAVLLAFGSAALRVTWVAFAYLLLMVPFWDAFTEPLHLPFQSLSASIGIGVLQFLGIPAHRDGVMLYLPHISLEVARACSGVNYLVAILALGIPLSYLYLPTLGRRVVLLVVSIGVAALSNGLRVAMIGVLAYLDFDAPLHGPGHVLHGLFVSAIGYVVLLVGLGVLTPKGTALVTTPPAPPLGPQQPAPTPAPRALRFAPAACVAALFLALGIQSPKLEGTPVPLPGTLDAIPVRLGQWTAVGMTSAAKLQWWTSADATVEREYITNGLPRAEVAVAYFARQGQGHEMVNHLTAGLHRRTVAGTATLAPGTERPNLVRLGGDRSNLVGYFWYELDGVVVVNPYEAKARVFWNRLVHQRSNGVLVVVLAPLAPESTRTAQDTALLELARSIHRALGALVWSGGLPQRLPTAN